MKMSFRYNRLSGTASNAVDAVKLEIPSCWVVAESKTQRGFKFLKFRMAEYLKSIIKLIIQKFETLSLDDFN